MLAWSEIKISAKTTAKDEIVAKALCPLQAEEEKEDCSSKILMSNVCFPKINYIKSRTKLRI